MLEEMSEGTIIRQAEDDYDEWEAGSNITDFVALKDDELMEFN